MTSIEEFTAKMRQLIEVERHAEIEETKCVMHIAQHNQKCSLFLR